MKTAILVLACATLAASVRVRRSYGHAQAYPEPVSVHTVVRPSNTLPVYEYPESTQIDTHSKTVYSVSVPITHTVHLEQPGHSRQVIYHNPPARISSYNSYAQAPVYNAPQTSLYSYTSPQVYSPQVYTPQVATSQVYSPSVYTPQVYSPTVYTPQVYSTPVYRARQSHQRVYNVVQSPWPYQRYADPWC